MLRHGCEARGPVIAPPATPAELATVERECGVTFPRDFAEVVTHHSASVSLYWRTIHRVGGVDRRYDGTDGDRHHFSAPYRGIFSGWAEYLWNLTEFSTLQTRFLSVQDIFPREPPAEEAPSGTMTTDGTTRSGKTNCPS